MSADSACFFLYIFSFLRDIVFSSLSCFCFPSLSPPHTGSQCMSSPLPPSPSKPFASSVLSLHTCGNVMQRSCCVPFSATPAHSLPMNAKIFCAVAYCNTKVDNLFCDLQRKGSAPVGCSPNLHPLGITPSSQSVNHMVLEGCCLWM